MGNWLSKAYFVLSLKFPEGLMDKCSQSEEDAWVVEC